MLHIIKILEMKINFSMLLFYSLDLSPLILYVILNCWETKMENLLTIQSQPCILKQNVKTLIPYTFQMQLSATVDTLTPPLESTCFNKMPK